VHDVAIVGAGRFGRTMDVLLRRCGLRTALVHRGEPMPDAGVTWLAVRDSDLGQAAAEVRDGAVTLHASGALAPDVLPERLVAGVLHPMMTFPGPELAIPALTGVPARIDGAPAALDAARALAERLGMRPLHLRDGARWHAAACMVSGHLGALTLLASEALHAAGLDAATAREALAPLARTSLENALAHGVGALTGPAVREDRATIDLHLRVLPPDAQDAYDALSRAIAAYARTKR
jgi:predicted short-subunit dehydrogenase-like oxidoreductase (DUF2520 family)